MRQTSGFLADLAAKWDGKKVLLIAHSANLWALQHLLHGVPLADLVGRPFDWRPGWTFRLPGGWESPARPE